MANLDYTKFAGGRPEKIPAHWPQSCPHCGSNKVWYSYKTPPEVKALEKCTCLYCGKNIVFPPSKRFEVYL